MIGDQGDITFNRQVWSNMSRGFFDITDAADGSKVVNASCPDESQLAASLEWHEAQFDPMSVPWYLVFTSADATKYVLSINQANDVKVLQFTEDMLRNKKNYQHCMFIPGHFGLESGSPFQCLGLMKDNEKCLAVDRNGNLRVKRLDIAYPHPETIFVISEERAD